MRKADNYGSAPYGKVMEGLCPRYECLPIGFRKSNGTDNTGGLLESAIRRHHGRVERLRALRPENQSRSNAPQDLFGVKEGIRREPIFLFPTVNCILHSPDG